MPDIHGVAVRFRPEKGTNIGERDVCDAGGSARRDQPPLKRPKYPLIPGNGLGGMPTHLVLHHIVLDKSLQFHAAPRARVVVLAASIRDAALKNVAF